MNGTHRDVDMQFRLSVCLSDTRCV